MIVSDGTTRDGMGWEGLTSADRNDQFLIFLAFFPDFNCQALSYYIQSLREMFSILGFVNLSVLDKFLEKKIKTEYQTIFKKREKNKSNFDLESLL